MVEYDKGFPKEKRVTWDAVTADQVKDYHSFTVTGHVEGVEKEAQAQVTVEGIIAVEEVSTDHSSRRKTSSSRKRTDLSL